MCPLKHNMLINFYLNVVFTILGTQFSYIFNKEPDVYSYLAYFQFSPKSVLTKRITHVLSLLLGLIIEQSFGKTHQADVCIHYCQTSPGFEYHIYAHQFFLGWFLYSQVLQNLSLIHIWRCRRSTLCRSRWSPYH